MSSDYQSDDEQVEALKKWWKDNGSSTLIGIGLSIAAVFGWQGWQQQQQAQADQASATYQNFLTVVSQEPLAGEQLATANHLAETLKSNFSSSTYAQFAALYKAQFAVKEKNLDQAETELRWVLDQRPSAEIAVQASLRLARVLHAKNQHDEALALLQGDALAYSTLFEELKGDIYLAKGDVEKAKQAYQQAKQLNQTAENPINTNLLELKIQQLQTTEEA